MKLLKIGFIASCLMLATSSLMAQRPTSPVVNMDSLVFNQSPRMLERSADPVPTNLRWSKTVYRFLALNDSATVAQNGYIGEPRNPIQYLSEAGGAKQKRYYYNLISVILRLLDDQKIPAYLFDTQAVDESFSAEEALTPDSALLKLGLVRTPRTPKFDRADFTYAGSGVTGYLLKELWYFDSRSSQFGCRVVALAPVTQDANGAGEFTPAFWLTYESLQPYLSQLAMKSETGSTTFDSFFRKRAYKGVIYKVQNSGNETLWNKCHLEADPRACRQAESDRVDAELQRTFQQVWKTPTPPAVAEPKITKPAAKVEPKPKATK